MGSIAGLNGLLDNSPVVQHEATIVRKYTSRAKNSTNYHVECKSWRDPAETERFQISSSEYQNVREGQSQMLVTTHAGGLGIEWIQFKRVGPPPKAR